MKNTFFIIWLLIVALCFSACVASLPAKTEDPTESTVEPLVEEWDSKMFWKMRGGDLTNTDAFIELLAEVIEQEDVVSLQNLYAPNVWNNAAVGEQAESLFEFFEGTIASVTRLAVSKSDSKDGDFRKADLSFSCDIETTVRTYRMAGKLCIIDSTDVNNIGICSLYIIDAANTDMQFAYWGNHEWLPGIVIDTEPYFPPPLPTETSAETTTLSENADTSVEEARLIVNGRDITEGNYVRINHEQYNAEIPVIAIFRELGYDVKVEANGDVIIDNDYVLLETAKTDFGHTIYETDTSAVRKKLDGEFVIDVWTASGWWFRVFSIDVEIDFDADTIYVTSFDPDAYEEYCLQLIVNGKDITEGNAAYLREYYSETVAELPVLAIMKTLGATVTWSDTGIITIEFDGKTTELDMNDDEFGWIAPPGGRVIRKATDTEVYMEWSSLRPTLQAFMGADLRIDYDQHIVYVDFIDNT